MAGVVRPAYESVLRLVGEDDPEGRDFVLYLDVESCWATLCRNDGGDAVFLRKGATLLPPGEAAIHLLAGTTSYGLGVGAPCEWLVEVDATAETVRRTIATRSDPWSTWSAPTVLVEPEAVSSS